jgi:hypothetical protein
MQQVQLTHRYHLLRASEKKRHDDCLVRIAEAGEDTRFGTLYLIDDGRMIKAGVAGQQQIANRKGNLQTGNSNPLRVVTLCFFYSREVALEVERELKRRHAPRRAEGGSEWFDIPRKELSGDVLTVAHELAFIQMRAAAAGATPIRPGLANYFYGLLMFDIEDGELRQSWDATAAVIDLGSTELEAISGSVPKISADEETKRSLWDWIRRLVGVDTPRDS